MNTIISESDTTVNGLKLHYREAGRGEPVLLLHGWPTSSFLWRNILPVLAQNKRAIALDLPGFGNSNKPLNIKYTFRFYEKTIEGFLKNLGINRTSLAVHDLGGPLGLYWACSHPDKLDKLAILNTLVYPEMSWAVKAFIFALRTPGLRSWLTSASGLRAAMRTGMRNQDRLTDEVISGVTAPFNSDEARKALIATGLHLNPKGFFLIAQRFPQLKAPLRVIYGEHDRILPDIAKTAARIKTDHPETEVTVLSDCGHFLQEDNPEEVGRLLADFFK